MRILWVATKAPWPPVDGGRLVLLNTLRALAAAGHEVTLVAPIDAGGEAGRIEAALRPWCRPSMVPVRRRPLVLDAVRSQLTRSPLTIVRHALPAVRRRVEEHLGGDDFDLIQAEQVQSLSSTALSSTAPASARRMPVVLRAQNVESDLWSQTALQGSWRRPLLALEARRLAAWEGRAVRRCAATLALTAEDAERLGALAGTGETVHHVPAPFAAELPGASKPLPGSPPVVLFGSGGWRPNAAGASWFLSRVWPRMRSVRPAAMLHVFGINVGGSGVVSHPPPADSRAAYPRGGILVVPLRIASGVRIKILEAWARGTPVIATPEAARGLAAEPGEQLLLARDGEQFSAALNRLTGTELAAGLVEKGRRHLRRRHDSQQVAERLTELYEAVKTAAR